MYVVSSVPVVITIFFKCAAFLVRMLPCLLWGVVYWIALRHFGVGRANWYEWLPFIGIQLVWAYNSAFIPTWRPWVWREHVAQRFGRVLYYACSHLLAYSAMQLVGRSLSAMILGCIVALLIGLRLSRRGEKNLAASGRFVNADRIV